MVSGIAAVVAATAVAAAIKAPAKAELQADAIPIGSGLGRAWHLGGFSDLFPEGSSGKEFWSLTDRGPNLDEGVGNTCTEDGKVYPLPGFTPEIVRLGVKDEELRVKDRTPLTFAGGPAVGYSVRPAPKNEASFDENCASLGTSPRGIDSEGLVVDFRDRSFWIADEYLPSVMHVRQDGRVLTRVVPVGTEASAAGAGATIVGAFPETVGVNFRPNRGFEGIAISPDGRTLYTALQSPMEYRVAGQPNPSPNPRNSLALRVFRLDISAPGAPVVTGQWALRAGQGTRERAARGQGLGARLGRARTGSRSRSGTIPRTTPTTTRRTRSTRDSTLPTSRGSRRSPPGAPGTA